MNPLIQSLLTTAFSQVGQREIGGNNCGPAVVKYQSATWIKPGPWPWCAAFVAWVIKEWLQDPSVRQYFKVDVRNLEQFRYRGASCNDAISWAKAHGFQVLDKGTLSKAGDIILFDWNADRTLDHIGLVVEDQMHPTDKIKTVEGNASALPASDSPAGDGVVRQERSPALVGKLIRMIP